jgi:hypothetical protein
MEFASRLAGRLDSPLFAGREGDRVVPEDL